MRIYAGGPVDYSTKHARLPHELMDLLAFKGIDVYCPQCGNDGVRDDATIMTHNQFRLLDADMAVFLLDGTFTVGTPVEIAEWIKARPARDAAIIHPGEPGLFVRMWALQGVNIFKTVEEYAAWLLA